MLKVIKTLQKELITLNIGVLIVRSVLQAIPFLKILYNSDELFICQGCSHCSYIYETRLYQVSGYILQL